MAPRSAAHADEEKVIFDALREACPSFAAGVEKSWQPEAEFPDVIVKMQDGTEIDFELTEWLDGVQMAEAMRRKRLEKAILAAIGPQADNQFKHFRAVMLCPHDDAPPFSAVDSSSFKAALFELLQKTNARWLAERSWHSPQGHTTRDLAAHPPLGRYLKSILFDPYRVGGEIRSWPSKQPYIFVTGAAMWYSPHTALDALKRIVSQKVRHYSPFRRPTQLLIYYGRAITFNTPYNGVARDFADVARYASKIDWGQVAFERICLLNAMTPGLEAFEIFPTFLRLH